MIDIVIICLFVWFGPFLMGVAAGYVFKDWIEYKIKQKEEDE
jgi:hypothetical protein